MTSDDVDRFRNLAKDCRDHAAKAGNRLDKEAWLRMANDWDKLAKTIEGKR